MNVISQQVWHRRGTSVVWDPAALALVTPVQSVLSLRGFFDLCRIWPADLPLGRRCAVVAGLDACLDSMAAEDAREWLDGQLRPKLIAFQTKYDGSAVIFWVAGGADRITTGIADGTVWMNRAASVPEDPIDLGSGLWGGAAGAVSKLASVNDTGPGARNIGLYVPRIS